MKIIMICGTRTNKLKYTPETDIEGNKYYSIPFKTPDEYIDYSIHKIIFEEHKEQEIKIIEGGAHSGADYRAKLFCVEHNINHQSYPPDFSNGYHPYKYFQRNHQMVDLADEIYAFWDGKSRGTLDVINYAKMQGKEVTVIDL